MSELTVRAARPEDLETVVRFNQGLATETEGLSLDDATVRAGVGEVLRDAQKGAYFLAEIDGQVVGQLMTTYEWSDWRNGLFLWIQSVYVDPAHRRQGVYRTLFNHITEEARKPGRCGVRLYVHRSNEAARRTYLRLGMVDPEYAVFETPDSIKSD